MQFKQLFFSLLLCAASFSLNAQESQSFPVSGTYSIQRGNGDRMLDFNSVSVNAGNFSLLNNGEVIRAYKIVSEIKGGYHVEQYLPEGISNKESFNITMDTANERDVYVTIHYTNGSEKLHLVR